MSLRAFLSHLNLMKTDLNISPSLNDFKDLAKKYNVIPIWSEILADLTTPVSLFSRCIGDGEGVLLESVARGEHRGRRSFKGGNT